jgi:hypothetical protein
MELFFLSLPADQTLLTINLLIVPALLGWLSLRNGVIGSALAALVLLQFSGFWTRRVDWGLSGEVTSTGTFALRLRMEEAIVFLGCFLLGLAIHMTYRRVRRRTVGRRPTSRGTVESDGG